MRMERRHATQINRIGTGAFIGLNRLFWYWSRCLMWRSIIPTMRQRIYLLISNCCTGEREKGQNEEI